MRNERTLATFQEKFPYELQSSQATFEVKMDDQSTVLFIPLQSGGLAIQVWRASMAKAGASYLLSGSALLSEVDMDRLVDSVILRRKVA